MIFANKSELTPDEIGILIEIIKAVGALVVFILVVRHRKKKQKKEEQDRREHMDLHHDKD